MTEKALRNHDGRVLTRTVNRTWGNNEAADYIGCTPKTLRVWVSKRRVPFVRVGRLVRFRQEDLDEWLDRNRVPEEVQG